MAERTNLIDQLRAILLERGVTFPVGRHKLEQGVDGLLAEGDHTLSSRMSRLVAEMRAEWKELDAKIEMLSGEFVEMARSDAAMRRLTTLPGIGVLHATALVAAVGDASSFGKARDLGAWLGLVLLSGSLVIRVLLAADSRLGAFGGGGAAGPDRSWYLPTASADGDARRLLAVTG